MESILQKFNDLILPTLLEGGAPAKSQAVSPPAEAHEEEGTTKIVANVLFAGVELNLKVKKNVYQLILEDIRLDLLLNQEKEVALALGKLALNLNSFEILQKLSLTEKQHSNLLDIKVKDTDAQTEVDVVL
jgi:hypothetical protein